MPDFLNITSYPQFLKGAAGLASEYNLRICRASYVDYALLGVNFAIVFLLDQDGVDLRFVDLPANGMSYCYALGHFLVAQGRVAPIRFPSDPELLRPAEKIPVELEFSLALLGSAPDILKGEREWLRNVPFPRRQTSEEWLTELHECSMRS
jgi:hypothetical protein